MITFSQRFPKDDQRLLYYYLLYKVRCCLLLMLIILLSGNLVVNAQSGSEHWDTYMARFGNKPGSVLVDMGLFPAAPDKKTPYLVITGPKVQNCNNNGLPATDEISGLEDILESTSTFLSGITAKTLAGTVTYNCERLNYYYVKDTTGIRNALARMYSRSFNDHPYSVKIRYDPDWTTYKTFLYPGPEMLRWMESDKIITAMLQSGDSLKEKRNINFKFNFQTEQGRKQFSEVVRGRDYKADKLYPVDNGSIFGVTVTKFDLVRIGSVDSMSSYLQEEGKKYGGVFIGWDAPVKISK